MDMPMLIDWLNKANIMIQEFAYEILILIRQFIDSYGLPLNEVEFLMIISISTLAIVLIFKKIRKPRRSFTGFKRSTSTKRSSGINEIRRDYYQNPGTYDIEIHHPTDVPKRKRVKRKSWDEELDDFVKRHKGNR